MPDYLVFLSIFAFGNVWRVCSSSLVHGSGAATMNNIVGVFEGMNNIGGAFGAVRNSFVTNRRTEYVWDVEL